jgi:uncharacterized membrane protein
MKDRSHLHAPASAGERIADAVAANIGSWRFLLSQTAFIALWVSLNLTGILHADPWPLIFLNLLMSLQAAYASPLIMLSQNRAAARDKQRDDLEAQEVSQLLSLTQHIDALQLQQMDILTQLSVISSQLSVLGAENREPTTDD